MCLGTSYPHTNTHRKELWCQPMETSRLCQSNDKRVCEVGIFHCEVRYKNPRLLDGVVQKLGIKD